MTDPNLNILERLEREWRDLCSGIRQDKMEELFMQVATATKQSSASFTLTDAERTEALALHDRTDQDFLQQIEGLSEAQWTFRPGPNRWSVQETAEHVILAESFIQGGVKESLAKDTDPNAGEEAYTWETMKIRVMDRSVRGFQAPPPMSPRGQWSLADTVRRFRESRAAIRELLATPDLPLKAHLFAGPPGTFTCYHWLVLVSLHTRRHLAQIVEVKTTAAGTGFPQ
jgi:hypothetical protein